MLTLLIERWPIQLTFCSSNPAEKFVMVKAKENSTCFGCILNFVLFLVIVFSVLVKRVGSCSGSILGLVNLKFVHHLRHVHPIEVGFVTFVRIL